jgi:multidrug efflux pump subunit AcrA (membrane-fusion protein)
MNPRFWKNAVAALVVLAVAVLTGVAVRRYQQPGRLDVLTAQAMDMSQMRPPAGVAPVALAAVRRGSLGDVVTYTGTVAAYNEQDIAARIAGTVTALPVYPGDRVRAGQVVARLDTAELGARAAQATAAAQGAETGARIAELTHHLHHQAAVAQAVAQTEAASESVVGSQADAKAAEANRRDAQAGIQSAQASADYWKIEIGREKALADAGAASRQEYQNELSQAQAADAALRAAQAKAASAAAMLAGSAAREQVAERQADAAVANQRMAMVDLTLAGEQAKQAISGAAGAAAGAREAAVVEGYARITSPSDGVVVDRPIAPGTLVQPGAVLLRVAEIDRVRVQAHVAVADLAGVAPGTPVELSPSGGGSPFHAKITAVFPSADPMTRTAIVEAVVPNPGHRLLPGAYVTVRLQKRAVRDTLLVPASALITVGGQSVVWVAQGGGAAAGSAAPVYECAICHMHYSAADAARHHYVDPMDGGKLTLVAQAAAATHLTVRSVPVTPGATDGQFTEIALGALDVGARVVTRGQAGLTDGAGVVATEWGASGPATLPTAAQAAAGQTRYRCEKCGMTYSAADARKNGYVDPMDGGKLTAVKP